MAGQGEAKRFPPPVTAEVSEDGGTRSVGISHPKHPQTIPQSYPPTSVSVCGIHRTWVACSASSRRSLGGRIMAVKVYGPSASPATARVLLCLEEVATTYEMVPIDFATGEHKSPAHLARNPFGQVPALEDGDLILFESRAIARYVSRKFKSGIDLIHEGNPTEAALVDVWQEVEAQQFDKAIVPIITQLIYIPVFFGGTTDEKIVAENVEKLGKVLDVYEERLSRSKFLAGDFISLADISHVPLTHLLMSTPHASVVNERPHVKAWWESLTSRPSYSKVYAAAE